MGTRRVRRRSGLHWLGAAVTPWFAGAGLLVSFTADAGTESAIGASLAVEQDARVTPALPSGTRLIGGIEIDDGAGALLGLARAEALRAPRRIGDAALRADLKAQARVFPVVQRSAKGDPERALAASFSRGARDLREAQGSLIFANLTGSVSGVLTPGAATWSAELEPDLGFVAVPDLGQTVGPGATPGASAPLEAAGDAQARHGDLSGGLSDGATPAVPRAVALSSTTPAPADATPIEVAAASLALPGFSLRTDRPEGPAQSAPDGDRHRYADLIDPDSMDREQRCLAEAVYFEARSEPEEGQAAVAQVVLNRVKSGLYPSNVCGVVYQNRHRYMGCQFSFACEGKSLRITDAGSWESATRVARSVIEGRTYLAEVGAATHYHADYVRPNWSRRLKRMDVIGRHIFYALKRGQT
ncbi:cell wall hydrolase [Methylobacterium sp. A54F]